MSGRRPSPCHCGSARSKKCCASLALPTGTSTWARSTRSSPASHKSVQRSLMRVLTDNMRRESFCDSCVTHPPGLMCASIPHGAFVAHVNTLCETPKALYHKASRFSTGPKNTFHGNGRPGFRSEEHTSELQSRFEFVCHLPLVKKNIIILNR